MELWLLLMTQGQTPATDSISLGKCFTYNNKGRCGRPTCRYLHKWLRCAGSHAALYCTLNKSGQDTQAERGIVKYLDTNTNSGRGDFRKERNLTNHNNFVFVKESPRHREQEKSQLIELGRTPITVDNLRHYLKIYPNRDDAFVLLDGFTSGFRVNYTGQ